MRQLYVIAHNIRSTHNVGSLLRTAEGIGVTKVFFSGYTPYPAMENDMRLPHMAAKVTAQIRKTALGAELTQPWEYTNDIDEVFNTLEQERINIVALEQTSTATSLPECKIDGPIALLIGSEVTGIDKSILKRVTTHVEIPMFGSKESFNVVQATAMALFYFRFF